VIQPAEPKVKGPSSFLLDSQQPKTALMVSQSFEMEEVKSNQPTRIIKIIT
jgi:hypothetical protein